MANTTKNHYYVLVLTMEGAMFVTGTEGHKTALWDRMGTPMEFSKEYANDMAIGLTWNGSTAFVVVSKFELDVQPFLYSKGHFEWVNAESEK